MGFYSAFRNEKIIDYQLYFQKCYFYLHFRQKRPKTGQNIFWFTTSAATFCQIIENYFLISNFYQLFSKIFELEILKRREFLTDQITITSSEIGKRSFFVKPKWFHGGFFFFCGETSCDVSGFK